MMMFIVFFALKLLFKTKLQGASLYVRKMLSEEGGFARGNFLDFTFPPVSSLCLPSTSGFTWKIQNSGVLPFFRTLVF